MNRKPIYRLFLRYGPGEGYKGTEWHLECKRRRPMQLRGPIRKALNHGWDEGMILIVRVPPKSTEQRGLFT